MSSCDNSNIRKNYIVSGVEQDILSACTGFYTNDIYPCTGDTIIVHSDILSANTINSSVILSGGTNLLDIFGSMSANTFVSASTLSGSTLVLTRNDGVELTTDLSSLPIVDLGRILFVAETGDDTTGTKGDVTKPWRNLYAAKSASTSGDTVYVFPGTWTYDNTATAGKPYDDNVETLVNLWRRYNRYKRGCY